MSCTSCCMPICRGMVTAQHLLQIKCAEMVCKVKFAAYVCLTSIMQHSREAAKGISCVGLHSK